MTGTDPASLTDGQLVEAVLRNRQTYALLVLRYENVLGRYIRRLLGRHSQSADDVLQDVFIKAYINLNDYDRSRPFGPWIYRIAHNESIGLLRKYKTQPQTITGEDALLILERLTSIDDPGEKWLRMRTDIEVRKALSELEPRYREVLVLRYLEEKSYDEIADILEMPPGTVATFIKRGLMRLEAPLRKSWDAT